jgi:hypothetical protein
MNDLILLHQWSVVTSLTIVNTPGVDHIWQTVMVQVGTQNPYVMQGIFSLTALHLAYRIGRRNARDGAMPAPNTKATTPT